MFIFQIQKNANAAQKASKEVAQEVIVTYRNTETGKEYHRHLLKNS